jgi:hypothetical protein
VRKNSPSTIGRVGEYVGLAFVVEPDGDEVEVRASLRGDGKDWGDYLIGPADWLGIASSTEPCFELRLPDGRSGACFVSDFDQASTAQRVTVAGIGTAPFK